MDGEMQQSRDFYSLAIDIFKTLRLKRVDRGENGKEYMNKKYGLYAKVQRNLGSNETEIERDGKCNTDENDQGTHTVCAQVTDEFLEYTNSQGNDLTTPRGGFPGLKEGDKWCLCALRWKQAHESGKAPLLDLNATNSKTLEYVDKETLKKYNIEN